ncbi:MULTISPECIES: helix-turn-helix domain-containing protein [Paraburkholderia]|jgi:transcriptional regulator with XRE-family HTH domain|uniref:Helix-turn-helix domain-containing protein n=1 Tax=Paraburkholderia phenazinium TaxID=60549 RepID=A0A1N6JKI0_9BURK|nr:Helix-turn-helix domain-containing protein [Paraburkholderia phenazinium]
MRRQNKEFVSPDLRRRSEALGSAISAARIARNMSRQDFSERASISPSTLMRIERGDVSVNFLAWLQALERAGLLGLLEPLSLPQADVVGESKRKAEARKRPRRSKVKDDPYDF